MTIKVVTFDLDDTLWPLRETILAAHKSANDFLASQVPSVKEILSTNKEREVWDNLKKKLQAVKDYREYAQSQVKEYKGF